MINKKLLTTIIASLSLVTASFSASPSSSSSGKSSGGSSFGGGSSSFSKPSVPSAPKSSFGGSSWGKAAPAPAAAPKTTTSAPPSNPAPKSSWGVSKPSSQPIESNTDRKIAAKTISNGGVASREEAVAKFKEKNKSKYTTTYDKEPAVRPNFVPSYTYSGVGNSRIYNYIYFEPSRRSYGYWDNFGSWVVFDALSRAAEEKVTVNNYGNYSYEGYALEVSTPVVTHYSFWRYFFDTILVIMIIWGITFFIFRKI